MNKFPGLRAGGKNTASTAKPDSGTPAEETPAGLPSMRTDPREQATSTEKDSPATEPTVEEPTAAAEIQVGRKLRAAREALNLSVSDIAQRLRLGERQILALETGDLAALPGRTFVRGFVRNYAHAVNLEAELLLKTLDGVVDKLSAPGLNLPESTHVVMPGRQERSGRDSSMVIAGLILLLIAVLLYFFLPEQSWMRVRDAQWTNEPQSEGAQQGEEDGAVSVPVVLPLAAPEPTAPADARDASEPTETVAPSTPSASSAVPSARGSAQFSFAQESWVEVRDKDGVILSSRQYPAGTRHTISGAPPLTVMVGKASGVTLTYRGKSVPLKANAENDVARVVLP
jgi:cytoskeleton protein RodZ